MVLPESMRPPNGFVFDTPEGRPFRITSIETEVDGQTAKTGAALYKCGSINSPHRQEYKYNPGTQHPHIAFFAYDGTVTCGELVFDRVDLTREDHASALVKTMEEMYSLEKAGTIQYNPTCGGHVHIDAGGYGFYDLTRLILLAGHLEEPIFRLAGAGKTYGHRTLYRGHDYAMPGRVYTDPIVKGPWGRLSDAFTSITGMKRHSAINTKFYVKHMIKCNGRCGNPMVLPEHRYRDDHEQVLGTYRSHDMKSCNCKKAKLTIEWRVWNSQGNPRIMYAWIALMQAMHAYTWRPLKPKVQYERWDSLPVLAWTKTPYSKLPVEVKRAAQERVEWMFTELPLTPVEKDALRYAYMKTPYKTFGKDFFERLVDSPYKAPPFPNEYAPVVVRKIGEEAKVEADLNEDMYNQPAPFARPERPQRARRAEIRFDPMNEVGNDNIIINVGPINERY